MADLKIIFDECLFSIIPNTSAFHDVEDWWESVRKITRKSTEALSKYASENDRKKEIERSLLLERQYFLSKDIKDTDIVFFVAKDVSLQIQEIFQSARTIIKIIYPKLIDKNSVLAAWSRLIESDLEIFPCESVYLKGLFSIYHRLQALEISFIDETRLAIAKKQKNPARWQAMSLLFRGYRTVIAFSDRLSTRLPWINHDRRPPFRQ